MKLWEGRNGIKKSVVGMYVFLCGREAEALRSDGVGDRMMMGADQSPKLFF